MPRSSGHAALPGRGKFGALAAALVLAATPATPAAANASRAPVRHGSPRITGTARVGRVITARHGRWSHAASFAYRWERCNAHAVACAPIGHGARGRGRRYRITRADLGHRLRVIVVASNHVGHSTAASRPTAVVRGPAGQTGPGPTTPTPSPPLSTGAGLHVVGNRLENASGQTVVLHGVDRSGTEYMCSEGYGIFDGPNGGAEFTPMRTWKINSDLIGLNEDCWLGINGIKSAYAGQNYINAIKAEVSSAESAGIYPVIGFFWGDPGTEVPTGYDPNGGGQPPMPDSSHAPLFWEEVADTFKSDPNVIFRLQEEPHPAGNTMTLAAWKCWSQGDVQYGTSSDRAYGTAPTPVGSVSHCSEKATNGTTSYKTVGMQSLIDIIRGTGATNVIQVPGLAYANMAACSPTGSPTACGMLDSTDGVRVADPLAAPQLMADFDMYPDAGQYCDTTTCYHDTLAPVAAVMPIDLGEIGPNGSTDTAALTLLNWMDALSPKGSYYAWAWDTWAHLISSYSGTPASPWGTNYRSHLQAAG